MKRFGDGGHTLAEVDGIALAQPPPVADERLPAAQVDPLVQRRADFRLAAAAFELRGDHAGIVEHQHVAAAEQSGEIGDPGIAQPLGPHHQHPRRIARPRGAQRDAFGG